MDYLHETAVAIYHRRRRRRAVFTMTFVISLVLATIVYTASYAKWLGTATPKSLANASCNRVASNQARKPSDVTVNVYNTTDHTGLAASVGLSLAGQGFKVDNIDNDPLGKTILSPGVIRHGPNGTAGAILAATRLPGATLVQDDRTNTSVDLVLGKTFKRLSVPTKVSLSNTARLISMLSTKPASCTGARRQFAATAKAVGTNEVKTASGSVFVRVQ